MTAEPDRSPETENQNNSNGHGGRICPKCGTPLGQKNLCPDCDRQNGASASEESASARNASRRSRSASGNSNMDRFAQYQQLKQSLANDPKNFASVFRIVRTIQREYADYLPLDYINFYVEMYRAKCPFAVFVALMVPEWNTLYRRFLRCGWGNNRAYLLHPPLSWMYLLLADEKAYQEDVEATSNNLASKSRYTEDSRTYFNNFILSFGRFFEYTFNAVSLSIWGEDYLEFVDTSRSLSNQAKPIKLISVFGLNSEGWQEMVLHMIKSLSSISSRSFSRLLQVSVS